MQITAIYGQANAGKSAIADALTCALRKKGIRVARHSFAQPVKDMADALLSYIIPDDDKRYDALYGAAKDCKIKGWGVSPRQIMQSLGCEWVKLHKWREGYDNRHGMWAELLIRRLDDAEKHTDVVIIDDVRMHQEFRVLKSRHAFFVCADFARRPANNLTHGTERAHQNAREARITPAYSFASHDDLKGPALSELACEIAKRVRADRFA